MNVKRLVLGLLAVVLLLTLTAATPVPTEAPALVQDSVAENQTFDAKVVDKAIRSEDCEVSPIRTVGGPYDKTVVTGFYEVCKDSTGKTITRAIP